MLPRRSLTILACMWSFLCCVLWSSRAAAADLDITLQMILDAPKRVSYKGTITQQRYPADGDTVRIIQRVVHQHPDRERIEFLEPQNMRGSVVIRIRDDIYERESKGDSTVYSHRRRKDQDMLNLGLGFSSLNLLRANYDLTMHGRATLLNRPATLLSIASKHPGRRSKTVWVDRETGLVLRVEDRNEAGKLVEESFFSSIILNPRIDPAVFATNEWSDHAVEENEVIACGSMQEVQKEAGFALAAPVYLPAGFALDGLRVIRYVGRPMVHFIYTDGLAQVSLYERVAPPTDRAARAWPGGTPERRGDVDIWKRGPFTVLRRSDAGKLYTVVSSDITEAEAIKLIESLYVIKVTAETPAAQSPAIWLAGGVVMIAGLTLGGWIWRRRCS